MKNYCCFLFDKFKRQKKQILPTLTIIAPPVALTEFITPKQRIEMAKEDLLKVIALFNFNQSDEANPSDEEIWELFAKNDYSKARLQNIIRNFKETYNLNTLINPITYEKLMSVANDLSAFCIGIKRANSFRQSVLSDWANIFNEHRIALLHEIRPYIPEPKAELNKFRV